MTFVLVALLIAGALLYAQHRISAVLLALLGDFALARAHLKALAESPEGQFSTRLADLEDSVERLPQRWEEFKNEARRAEGRARALVRSAQEELERLGFDHEGLQEQGAELRLLDAEPSGTEAVPAVRQGVEGGGADPSDWRTIAARRKYGGA